MPSDSTSQKQDSMDTKMYTTQEELVNDLRVLKPWGNAHDFTSEDWQSYIEVAKRIKHTEEELTGNAIEAFIEQSSQDAGNTDFEESKPFLLLRVLFELPESAPASEGFSYKGWTNWPSPDQAGNVSLAWPISWVSGKPILVSDYEGAEGKPYAGKSEFEFLRASYPYRIYR